MDEPPLVLCVPIIEVQGNRSFGESTDEAERAQQTAMARSEQTEP
jgi:hypothetical protein